MELKEERDQKRAKDEQEKSKNPKKDANWSRVHSEKKHYKTPEERNKEMMAEMAKLSQL